MKIFLAFLVAAVGVAIVIGASNVAAVPPEGERTVTFGREGVGSGCEFPCEDDASFHAIDKIVPKGLAIPAGTQVNFDVTGFHAVSIYAPGKTPDDVVVDESAFPFVNDPVGKIAAGAPLTDFSFVFPAAGKYLVICEVAPHFESANMWMWVNVK